MFIVLSTAKISCFNVLFLLNNLKVFIIMFCLALNALYVQVHCNQKLNCYITKFNFSVSVSQFVYMILFNSLFIFKMLYCIIKGTLTQSFSDSLIIVYVDLVPHTVGTCRQRICHRREPDKKENLPAK